MEKNKYVAKYNIASSEDQKIIPYKGFLYFTEEKDDKLFGIDGWKNLNLSEKNYEKALFSGQKINKNKFKLIVSGGIEFNCTLSSDKKTIYVLFTDTKSGSIGKIKYRKV